MKISYNWLKEFVDFTASPAELSEVLTQTGLEVESIETYESIKGGLTGLLVGEVIVCTQHPNAEKLKLTQVSIGIGELLSIVCGAPNVAAGQKVIVAPVGTWVHPVSNEPFEIKKAKIRGELSEGMLCAEDEIGMGTSHAGLLILDSKWSPGSPLTEVFKVEKDHIIEIGLTPNRGDAASHLGTARDIKAFLGGQIKRPAIKESALKLENPISISIENNEACPRYSGVTIRGVKVQDSPAWLQSRLISIGLSPINNVVDITNYVLHAMGQPLHAFDADKIAGKKIIVKTLQEGTSFTTLDAKERKLNANDLMICDTENPLCIAGVFGGLSSGITAQTTSVFLESACFSQSYIRSTAMRHALSTDASFRFERGTDPEITLFALQYAANLIVEIAGGYRASEWLDIYPNPVKKAEIKTSYSTFDRLIGVELGSEKIHTILNSLDIETQKIDASTFTAIVPAYRSEVTRPADLVEEVLRIYGINNIPYEGVSGTGFLAEFNEREPYKLQEITSEFLSGKGFQEILTNSLTHSKYEEKLQLGTYGLVKMMNPSSLELDVMKPSLLYTGLEVVRHNLNRRLSDFKLFEFGKIYFSKDGQSFEQQKLSLYLTGAIRAESWMEKTTDSDLYDIKSYVVDVIGKCGHKNLTYKLLENDNRIKYGLQIYGNKKQLAVIGALKSELLEYFGIEQALYYGEIDWDMVTKMQPEKIKYQSIPKFPEVRRDLSLILDSKITFIEIETVAHATERDFLNRMNVFSVFEGEQIGQGKKAYAIAFYLQDHSQTLTEKQIEKTMTRLMREFETRLNAVIRK